VVTPDQANTTIDAERKAIQRLGRWTLALLPLLMAGIGTLLLPVGAAAEKDRQAPEQLLTASTVRSVQNQGERVVLILDDGTSLEAAAGSFRVLGVRPERDEEAEQVSREQRKDPAYREQMRQEREAERTARRPPVTDLQPGQAVLVMARVSDGKNVRHVMVRLYDSLQEAQEVLQERLQRQEERQQEEAQKGQEREQERGGGPTVEGAKASG